jgi:hypothetical protein
MYKIEEKKFGVKLTFGGYIKADEMAKWVNETKEMEGKLPSEFGVFVDMRDLEPLPVDSQKEMQNGQKWFKEAGMQRSVVILNNPITTIQFMRIAKETGIYNWERYIDASEINNWEEIGLKWVKDSIDPDK